LSKTYDQKYENKSSFSINNDVFQKNDSLENKVNLLNSNNISSLKPFSVDFFKNTGDDGDLK
jgi:hypothetical protein